MSHYNSQSLPLANRGGNSGARQSPQDSQEPPDSVDDDRAFPASPAGYYPTSLQPPTDPRAGQSSSKPYRPVSSIVYTSPPAPLLPPTQSPTPATRKRASHSVTMTSPHQQAAAQFHQPAYNDVYAHPAAVAYSAAHPRRQIPKFGPYLLLQTLGEGEFGKVKLGLHGEWGEEVAVKLIRRGSVDSAVRMSKVQREIEVLKTIKHPNIVRLYDVIETDKYIGIVLEYASGGELFDHILAHRFLKERDACKLFAQLISGVSYCHAKKIVHRDLKLENLLLDRHRNVIITDFGFANRFEHRQDDLMQTSCGSPCYAAPELVISEGLYVGSAVDIWSCGVILYAMLAGYLPFDDDPANPDGDNINLLYKYIINTPLTFPDYISAEARDLLSKMLVPDPARRSNLQEIMSHPWLEPYAGQFDQSVRDLEQAAYEQQQEKRMAYQRQMRERSAQGQAPGQYLPRSISQSAKRELQTASLAVTASPTRSRSARETPQNPGQKEFLYETSLDTPFSGGSPARRTASEAVVPSGVVADADDFPYIPDYQNGESSHDPRTRKESTKSRSSAKRAAAPPNPKIVPVPGSAEKKRKTGGYRHTIQLEYDGGTPASPGSSSPIKVPTTTLPSPTPTQSPTRPTVQAPSVLATSFPRSFTLDDVERDSSGFGIKATEFGDSPMDESPKTPTRATIMDQDVDTTPTHGRPPPVKASPVSGSPPSAYVAPPSPAVRQTSSSHSLPPTQVTVITPAEVMELDDVQATPLIEPLTTPGQPAASTAVPQSPASLSATPNSNGVSPSGSKGSRSSSFRHRKGLSVDKFNLANMLSSNKTAQLQPGAGAENSRAPSKPPTTGPAKTVRGASDSSSKPPTLKTRISATFSSSSHKPPSEAGSVNGEKKSRRKTLSLMIEPLNRTINRRRASRSNTAASFNPPEVATPVVESPLQTAPPRQDTFTSPEAPNNLGPLFIDASGPGHSTGKAKKVMDWFRKKSLARSEIAPDTPTDTSSFRQHLPAGHAPQVVITTPGAQQSPAWPSETQRNVSAGNQSHHSDASDSTNSALPLSTTNVAFPAPSTPMTTSNTSPALLGRLSKHTSARATASTQPFNKALLRIHRGAVDTFMITTGSPPVVFAHVTEILKAMGMEIQQETPFKHRCVRKKRKKDAVGSTTSGLTAFTVTGTAGSNGVDKRGLPQPSSHPTSLPSGMWKGFLRRGSAHVSHTSTARIPATSTLQDREASEKEAPSQASSSKSHGGVPMNGGAIEALYGDPMQDVGDEVRFSVELTRLDRLDDTYSLDIRRLKGNLRSYKFLYDTLRDRCEFST